MDEPKFIYSPILQALLLFIKKYKLEDHYNGDNYNDYGEMLQYVNNGVVDLPEKYNDLMILSEDNEFQINKFSTD